MVRPKNAIGKCNEIDKMGDKAFRALFTNMRGDQTPLEHILTKHKHFIRLRVPEKELQAVELTIDGMEVNANTIYNNKSKLSRMLIPTLLA